MFKMGAYALAGIGLATFWGTSFADQASVADQIEAVQTGLASEDEVSRIRAFEEAMKSDNDVVKDFAATAALESDDRTLRSLAVQERLKQKSTIIVFLSNPQSNRTGVNAVEELLAGTGGQFELTLDHDEERPGKFWGFTQFSKRDRNGNVERAYQGEIASDRISFTTGFYRIDQQAKCSGSANSVSGSTLLVGKMSCTGNGGAKFNYDIKIDIVG